MGSVTHWIRLLQAGDAAGAQPIFERYFDRLVQCCQARLSARPSPAADGEDVAQQVLATFFRRVTTRRYPNLNDRDGLWKLLLTVAARKAQSSIRHEQCQKRGGGRVVGENVLAGANSNEGWSLDLVIGDEPTPEMITCLNQTLEELDRRLPDVELRRIGELKLAGYLNAEIAEQLDCAAATIERRLRLMRAILRESEDIGPKR